MVCLMLCRSSMLTQSGASEWKDERWMRDLPLNKEITNTGYLNGTFVMFGRKNVENFGYVFDMTMSLVNAISFTFT